MAVFRGELRGSWKVDGGLASDLTAESRPVLASLDEVLAVAGDDPTSIEFRESLALAGLLGRRAAVLDGSPRLTAQLPEALAAALQSLGRPVVGAVMSAIRTVILEAYCVAREERVRTEIGLRAASAVAAQPIAPRCWAVFIGGEPEPATLERALDRVGRRLLDDNAGSCWVHVGVGADADEDLAAPVLGFAATCRLVGALAVFTGVPAAWPKPADELGWVLEERMDAGVGRALAEVGLSIREASPIVGRLRRLLAPGPP
jgi:hypothetical protein